MTRFLFLALVALFLLLALATPTDAASLHNRKNGRQSKPVQLSSSAGAKKHHLSKSTTPSMMSNAHPRDSKEAKLARRTEMMERKKRRTKEARGK
jgi:hypothetical protein